MNAKNIAQEPISVTVATTVEAAYSPVDVTACTRDNAFKLAMSIMGNYTNATNQLTRICAKLGRWMMEDARNKADNPAATINRIIFAWQNEYPKDGPVLRAWFMFHFPLTEKKNVPTTDKDGVSVVLDKGLKYSEKADEAFTMSLEYYMGKAEGDNFRNFKRQAGGTSVKAPLTPDKLEDRYTKLIAEANAAGLDISKYQRDSQHSASYYLNALESMDENDMTDEELARIRLLKGESLPFASLIKLMSNCDRSNLTPEQELFYEEVLKSAVIHGIEL